MPLSHYVNIKPLSPQNSDHNCAAPTTTREHIKSYTSVKIVGNRRSINLKDDVQKSRKTTEGLSQNHHLK